MVSHQWGCTGCRVLVKSLGFLSSTVHYVYPIWLWHVYQAVLWYLHFYRTNKTTAARTASFPRRRRLPCYWCMPGRVTRACRGKIAIPSMIQPAVWPDIAWRIVSSSKLILRTDTCENHLSGLSWSWCECLVLVWQRLFPTQNFNYKSWIVMKCSGHVTQNDFLMPHSWNFVPGKGIVTPTFTPRTGRKMFLTSDEEDSDNQVKMIS